MKGIVIFCEFSPPAEFRPGWFNSRIMFRVWWLWFSIGWYKMSLHDAHERIQNAKWIEDIGDHPHA